jgi:hypothetical protein
LLVLLPHPALQKQKQITVLQTSFKFKEKKFIFGGYFKSQLVSIGSVNSLLYKHQYIHISCAFFK